MDVFEAIRARYSYRGKFTDAVVPRGDIEKILGAGLDAPSGCNRQTVRLMGIDDAELLAAVNSSLNKPNHATANAAIIVFSPVKPAEYDAQDRAAAMENMLLAATALGYASCWVEGYLTEYDSGRLSAEISKILGAPDGWRATGYLPIGVPEKHGKPAAKLEFRLRAGINGIWED